MRHALFLIFSLFAALPLWADAERYETLLADLASAGSKGEAELLNKEIWDCWLTAPDETAQEILNAALERRANYDFLAAIEHVNRLIFAYPDYAEGWNQRATLYYLVGDYDASLADVDETLKREPRHFGALAGKSVILFNQGKIGLAKIAVREALKYHPYLNEAAILLAEPEQEL